MQMRSDAAAIDDIDPGVGSNRKDRRGRFGPFGGQYAPEVLMSALRDLDTEYESARTDPGFIKEMEYLEECYVGRPTPIYPAQRLTREKGKGLVVLKREDLAHTGAHKINNALGQALLASRMGKRRIIAETGAGQHGVAAATVCARLGMECVVYMGSEDVERQAPNVLRMRLLGARVVPVTSGSRTLKDAINEAMRDWVTNVDSSYYMIGSVVGPHPYPTMVRDFQSVIGREARAQFIDAFGRLPSHVVACVGGGSNAMGIFHHFVQDRAVMLVGAEAGGKGHKSGEHAATLAHGQPGVLHGASTYVLQDANGQITSTHSISAGLDYPGVGPEHSYLRDTGRASYVSVSDEAALHAFETLSRTEGIIPALESAHAVAAALEISRETQDGLIAVCLSGRGDKDLGIYEAATRDAGPSSASADEGKDRPYRTVGAP